MTGEAERERGSERPSLPARLGAWVGARVGTVDRRLRGIPAVQGTQSVMDTYNRAGGGLTAAGLAYGALFAVIPGLLLLASIAVIVVDSPEARQRFLDWIVEQVPPLHDFAKQIVTGLANGARVGTLIGLVGFIWGASGFYLGLQGAMGRIFPARRAPDPIWSRVQGILAVAIVVGAILAAFVAGSAVSLVWTLVGPAFDVLLPVVSPLIAIAGSTLVALAVYELVPNERPAFRAVLPAAVLAGIVMGLLTSLFGLLAPLLVGGLAGLGVLASVFVALVWFNWVFQVLLLGASYARLRNDQRLAQGAGR
ncbi:MAG: YihY/virulence factor BrkB family protein [Chloroflexota bacterium]